MNDRVHPPAYETDLAYVHDTGFGGFANDSAPGLLALLRKAGIDDGPVVDLGCGSGIWARHLTDAGYDATGIDISPAMLKLARNRAPAAHFQMESFRTAAIPPCRAVTALGEVLCYLLDPRNNAKVLSKVCRRIFDALEPGGLLIFDVAEVGLGLNRPPSSWEQHDWACLTRYESDPRKQQFCRHIVTFRKSGKLYRRHEETHRIQLYRQADVAAILRKIGFRVRPVRHYGDYALLPKRVGFIARKPSS
jgi:SAM-dependent methyltransferase